MVQGVKIENGCIVDVNPATGAVIDRVPVSSRAEVDAAVRAAKLAQPAWAALSVAERTVAVKAAVRRIGAIKVTLAPLITAEMGKTLREAESEVDDNSDMDAYCDLVAAANAPEFHGGSVIVRHAHGVVSICAPWNYPVEEIVLLSIPALIAGNAIVIKPSEVVPHASGAGAHLHPSKASALTWYRALTWYCSPARAFAAPDVPLLATGQQGSPILTC